jgi:hypothetical protein
LMKKESRHVSELSTEELLKYFPPPKSTYPDLQECPEHKIWFAFSCYKCVGEANLTAELFEECNLGHILPKVKAKTQKRIVRVPVPHLNYQYHNFLAENQK